MECCDHCLHVQVLWKGQRNRAVQDSALAALLTGLQERTASVLCNELTFLGASAMQHLWRMEKYSSIYNCSAIKYNLNFLTTQTEQGWFKGAYDIEKESPKD